MSPVTHLLLGWAVANSAQLEKRDRCLVTLAGIAPDVDGLGVIPEMLTKHTDHPLMWWSDYHHVFGHNLVFGLIFAAVAALLARRQLAVVGLVLASFHVHLLGDVLGGRGPDGYVWTVPYLWPISGRLVLSWEGQWLLNSWQNLLITGVLIVLTLRWAWKRGYSPLEMISAKADRAVVEALRRRFATSKE